MGLKRSRAALAGGTMASVLGAAIGVSLVVGAILGLVVFPASPRGTGSPQPAIVLPAGGGRDERAAVRPRSVEIARAKRVASRRSPTTVRTAPGTTTRRVTTRRGARPAPVVSAPARRVAATPTAVAPGRPAPTTPATISPPADALRPVSPTAAGAVQGAADTATGAVTQAGGALPPLPKTG